MNEEGIKELIAMLKDRDGSGKWEFGSFTFYDFLCALGSDYSLEDLNVQKDNR